MNILRFRAAIVGLALAGLCLPRTGWTADASVTPPPQITDLVLYDGGVLVGQVINDRNTPQSGIRVSLRDSQNREVATAVTDRQGAFTISGIRGGVYQLVTPRGRQIYRIWPQGMAPPSAQQTVRMVVPSGVEGIVSNPGVVGTLVAAGVATAIAVPVLYGAMKQPASP